MWNKAIDPGKVFDLTLPLDQVAEIPRDGRAAGDQDAAAFVKTSTGKDSEMTPWLKNDFGRFADTDDLHISPLREDGWTYGTPTWIWSVVVDGALYVRAYNGKESRWYKAALRQKAGRITAAGMAKEVTFEPVDGQINDRVDDAYRAKYAGSPYLKSMIGERARAATVRVVPRDTTKLRREPCPM